MFIFLAVGIAMGLMLFTIEGIWAGLLSIIGNGSRPPLVFLLMSKGVLENINATQAQKEKIRNNGPRFLAKLNEARGKLSGVAEAERPEKIRLVVNKINEAASEPLAMLFNPGQLTRLTQIERQLNVALTLLQDTTVAKPLKISDEQRNGLKTIHEESIRAIRGLQQQTGADGAIRQKVVAALNDANDKALLQLTDEQRKKWRELSGEPFEISMLSGGEDKK